jgi:hypothetical protein
MNARQVEARSPKASTYVWAFGVIFAFCFTLCIWLLGPYLKPVTDMLLLRNDLSWYYWKLPVRDAVSMVIAWAMYLAHQVSVWVTIYYAQTNRHQFRSHSVKGTPKYTWYVLVINVGFVVLHLLQTHVWFDGLAQDTPIMSSQGSVVVMLAVVLILEHPRRGFVVGRKAGKPFTTQVVAFFRRTHIYIFAWAMVYTFWFHPMATDPQLLSGFFYMFLLFTQMTVAWTPIHLDKRWIILLESYVALHAVIVALWNTEFFGGAAMWPMFFTGFAFMFVFTYMYAFKVSRRVYWGITTLYAAVLAWLYLPIPIGFGRSLMNLVRLEFLWIPLILYGLATLFAGLAYLKIRK